MNHETRRRPISGHAAALAVAAFFTLAECDGATPNDPKGGPAGPTRTTVKRVREPAVAGLFYPKEPETLGRAIDAYLAAARVEPVADLKALICPHAGYVYSGPTAAQAYKLLAGRAYETVILLAPSHYASFRGACVSGADVFRTPLGEVEISPKARELAKVSPFVPEAPARVQRPGWSAQSSRASPGAGEDTPDTWEHSDEVQVPFLQKTLKSFKLIPIVLGAVDAAEVARALADRIDDQTLIVVSSDLSHFHPYAEARELDTRCVKAICDLDVGRMSTQEACGKEPIQVLLHLARVKGWKARALDYRNSGDTAGDKERVVGYCAIAFHGEARKGFSAAERRQLLGLARATVRESAVHGRVPEVNPAVYPPPFLEPKGCFVTLTRQGRLRGCIGHIVAQEPLWRAIIDNAHSAALRDHRFTPVTAAEVGELEIEISILTEPQPLVIQSPEELLARLQPRRDGVVLEISGRRATYLPQVWEQLPDKVEFLNSLAEKAGCRPSDWRLPGTRVLVYHVESFKESE